MGASKGEARSLAFLLLLEGVSAFAWCAALGLALADLRVVKRVSDYAADAAEPEKADAIRGMVTAIVPARDEAANIGSWIDSILAQPAVGDVIVADDNSSDETAAIAEQRSITQPRVRVLRCDPPPAGWVGKNWAAHSAARCACGEWLLFSDADVRMQPGAVDAALLAARALDADALSLSATLECGSAAEKIVMPAVAALIFTGHPLCLIEDQRFGTALMAGGFSLVRRSAYDRIGGHAAVRGEIAEDRMLARSFKAFGYRLRLLNGSDLVRVRMYRGFNEMWAGWRKNFYEGTQRSPLGAVLFVTLVTGMLVLPAPVLAVLAARPRRRRLSRPQWRLFGLTAFGCASALAVRMMRDPLIAADARTAAASPLAGVFIAAVMIASAWRGCSGTGQLWKGRIIR
ncbi:MAG: glycosyltransferase family 2 protein [Candidatus Eremiobacteraeota bacterium]|nr:glycosyltransferase family 2 protein [Candidatus Eremiobacteraeota bacterium]